MKKMLSLFGLISLVSTSTISLVTCNIPEYSEDSLKKEKDKNNINTNGNILEWIAPQEKPFSQVDNKYYFVVWYDDISNNWKIIKFLNNKRYIKIYEDNNFVIRKSSDGEIGAGIALNKIKGGQEIGYKIWPDNDYFKSVYRWNGTNELETPEIDYNLGNIKN